ncbi:MAG: hypothetical protein A2679_03725 [Candidatus Sungbacteria bacterium RIFCSPHIGHO2_01_FULL_54_26]|uniref:Transcriptional repressor PaaX-like central Cas2-like domain-containing protein n=1 Tax=Candidatus Sungbacteria bacterium RIFCSPHIGHO2_02_FULL_53_17 TaxID=1802275 RepID=A0A1G2KUX8_9BACT|nr:MAG: hypothetical protein A2679_03725 [Candidatus Sungbacteria bacterium RIFCSPHIGHO2_01_FULL_54_26]OHA03247.1 MAG: hypothetical protein A3C92_03180 [Candidatus Sungbacteria bacterium RIFCSPHIGHO2_02_FULL_53_17]
MAKRLFKRKYEHKLLKRVVGVEENRMFLLAHLKKEWEAIERATKKDRRKSNLYDIAQKTGTNLGFALLGMVAVCGVLSVAAVAPNIFSAFSRFGKHRRYFDKKDLQRLMRYFRARKYLKVAKNDGGMQITLTDLGEEQVVKRTLGDLRIAPQERWDGIWRVVLFDIPERNKWAREGMRHYLKRMGFYPLQKSTFVFPYPCREEIHFLRKLYDVGHAIRYIETASIDEDANLRSFFSLS